MANYKETNVTGTQWKRAYRVQIDNVIDQIPRLTFDEQTITILDSETITKPVGHVTAMFDPTYVINLKNPQTGEAIPGATATETDLYVILYSLYIQLAEERDAAIQAALNPPQE